MPKQNILDPQGKAVQNALHAHGMTCVEDARVGKLIELKISGTNRSLTEAKLHTLCQELLSNPVIEDYHLKLSSPEAPSDLENTDDTHSPHYASRLIEKINALDSTQATRMTHNRHSRPLRSKSQPQASTRSFSSKEVTQQTKKKGTPMPTAKKSAAKKAGAKKPAAKKAAAKKKSSAKKS